MPERRYSSSLPSRRLEVVGTRKNGHARRRHAREVARVSPSRAPVLSFAHYFQAPATQADIAPLTLKFGECRKISPLGSRHLTLLLERWKIVKWSVIVTVYLYLVLRPFTEMFI